MPSDLVPIGTMAQFIPVSDNAVTSIRNDGPGTVYYGAASVSSSSNNGSIASGSTAVGVAGQWFVSASSSRLVITTTTVSRQYDRDQAQVGLVAPTCAGWAISTGALTASRANIVRFVPSRPMMITKIGFTVTTGAAADDACSVAIYNSSLVRLVTSGATTGQLNTTGNKNITITATPLQAGTVYYAGFSAGTFGGSAATLLVAAFANNLGLRIYGSTAGLFDADQVDAAHPLPDPYVIGSVFGSSSVLLRLLES